MERQAHVWHHVEVEIVWDQALLLVSIDGKVSSGDDFEDIHNTGFGSWY